MPPEQEDVTDLDEINEAVTEEDESTVDEETERARARGDFVDEDEDEEGEEEETLEETDEDEDEEDGNSGGESDSESEEADDEEDDTSAGEPRIPKSRLDKVIGQRETYREAYEKLEGRESQYLKIIEELQKGEGKTKEVVEKGPTFDMEAKEAEALDAILEGDSKAYTAVRKEINDYILSEAKASNAGLSESATKAARDEAHKIDEESRFQHAASMLSEKHTFLNSTSKDFNEEALSEVDRLFNKFVEAGDSKTDALNEAVSLISPRYTTAKSDLSELGEAKAKRRGKAVRKAAKATKQQPPESKGKETKQIEEFSYENLVDMTEKDWDKLPAAIKKKLRGD